MSDLFGNHIVGFPTRRLKCIIFSEQFTSIKKDNDQWRAAQLIASQPVVAISGKGGCGKTYVVTQVITAAKAARYAK